MVDVDQFVRFVGGGTEEGRSGGGGRGAVILPRLQNRVGNARSTVGAAIPPSSSVAAVKPERLEEKEDGCDPVSDDRGAGGTSFLDGGITHRNHTLTIH